MVYTPMGLWELLPSFSNLECGICPDHLVLMNWNIAGMLGSVANLVVK